MTRTLLRRAATGTAVAVVGVLALYLVARLAGDPLVVNGPTGSQPVPVALAALFTVVGGLAGLGLAVAAARAGRPRATFLGVTVAGLLLSLAPPFASAPVGTALWLDAMHLVVGAAVIPVLATALPRVRSRAGSPA